MNGKESLNSIYKSTWKISLHKKILRVFPVKISVLNMRIFSLLHKLKTKVFPYKYINKLE